MLKCKLSATIAVCMMTLGTVHDSPMIRAWSILVALLAVGLGVWFAILQATEATKAYVHRWTLETFEHGFKQGIEQGREIEAAERLMAMVRNHRDN
jgi:hypothetical protein